MKYILETIDWSAIWPFAFMYLPCVVILCFAALCLIEAAKERRIARDLRNRVKALHHGREAWDAPRKGHIHYIPNELKKVYTHKESKVPNCTWDGDLKPDGWQDII